MRCMDRMENGGLVKKREALSIPCYEKLHFLVSNQFHGYSHHVVAAESAIAARLYLLYLMCPVQWSGPVTMRAWGQGRSGCDDSVSPSIVEDLCVEVLDCQRLTLEAESVACCRSSGVLFRPSLVKCSQERIAATSRCHCFSPSQGFRGSTGTFGVGAGPYLASAASTQSTTALPRWSLAWGVVPLLDETVRGWLVATRSDHWKRRQRAELRCWTMIPCGALRVSVNRYVIVLEACARMGRACGQ